MSIKTFRSIFEGKQDKLEKMMDIEHGLLTKLEALNVITSAHKADINVNFVSVGIFKLNTALFCEIEEITVRTDISTQITLMSKN